MVSVERVRDFEFVGLARYRLWGVVVCHVNLKHQLILIGQPQGSFATS